MWIWIKKQVSFSYSKLSLAFSYFADMNLSTFASMSERGWLYSWLMHNPEEENLTVLKEGRYMVSIYQSFC